MALMVLGLVPCVVGVGSVIQGAGLVDDCNSSSSSSNSSSNRRSRYQLKTFVWQLLLYHSHMVQNTTIE
jgi:hypothetical protein